VLCELAADEEGAAMIEQEGATAPLTGPLHRRPASWSLPSRPSPASEDILTGKYDQYPEAAFYMERLADLLGKIQALGE
jgi:hypothetical protein